jgi:hypothetical protein
MALKPRPGCLTSCGAEERQPTPHGLNPRGPPLHVNPYQGRGQALVQAPVQPNPAMSAIPEAGNCTVHMVWQGPRRRPGFAGFALRPTSPRGNGTSRGNDNDATCMNECYSGPIKGPALQTRERPQQPTEHAYLSLPRSLFTSDLGQSLSKALVRYRSWAAPATANCCSCCYGNFKKVIDGG